MPTPYATRIRHDADELRRLADWLEVAAETTPGTAEAMALDYFRYSARLFALSTEAHDFALSLTRVIP